MAFESLNRSLTAVAVEGKIIFRLARYWLIVVVLSTVFLLLFLQACINRLALSISSPTFGFFDPHYLLHNIDPLVFVVCQFAVTLLAFDVIHRHRRESVLESIESRPVSNLGMISGQVLAPALCVWCVTVACFLFFQLVIWVSNFTDLSLGRPISISSAFLVIGVKLPLYLLIASSVTVLLSAILRMRTLSFFLIIGFYIAEYLALIGFLNALAPGEMSVAFLSREFPSISPGASFIDTLDAIAVLLFSVSMVYLAVAMYPRSDTITKRSCIAFGSLSMIVGCASWVGACWLVSLDRSTYEDFRLAHKHEKNHPEIEVKSVSGRVEIDPGRRLALDLQYELVIPPKVDDIVFSFNPGMQIEQIVVEGESVPYEFNRGLLTVKRLDASQTEDLVDFQIQASGKPNTGFAYLDASLNYFENADTPVHMRNLFGTESAIFDHDIVVLMPTIRWYPLPGRSNTHESFQSFDLDIEIEVNKHNWLIVGPGPNRAENANEAYAQFRPKSPVGEFAIVASKFEKRSIEFGHYKLDYFGKPGHFKNFNLFSDVSDSLGKDVMDAFKRTADQGFTYPFDSVSVVEVPHRLRMVGGGWRMPSNQRQPGVFLLRESGFPTALSSRKVRQIDSTNLSDEEFKTAKSSILKQYFMNALMDVGVQNWLYANYWGNRVQIEGPAREALEVIFSYLVSGVFVSSSTSFSALIELQLAPYLRRSLPSSYSAFRIETVDPPEGAQYTTYDAYVASRSGDFFSNPQVKHLIATNSLADFDYEIRPLDGAHLATMKGYFISSMANEFLSFSGVTKLLAETLNRYNGQEISLETISKTARDLEIDIDPFLSEWLYASELPGFLVSQTSTTQLPDSPNSTPQYRTTFHVRNDEDVTGIVSFRHMFTQGSEYLWSSQGKGVKLPGNTSIKVNLVTNQPIERLMIRTPLSLNEWAVFRTIAPKQQYEMDEHGSFALYTESDWDPKSDAVVVDDLDPGFSVKHQLPRARHEILAALSSWFARPRPNTAMDGNVVSDFFSPVGTPDGFWVRGSDSYAWGKYRQSNVYTMNLKEGMEAKYTAELPYTGPWKLEMYFAFVPDTYDPYRGRLGIRVFGEHETRELVFDAESAEAGWNSLGTFDIVNTEATVTVFHASKVLPYHWVELDAIRWLPVKVDHNRNADTQQSSIKQ